MSEKKKTRTRCGKSETATTRNFASWTFCNSHNAFWLVKNWHDAKFASWLLDKTTVTRSSNIELPERFSHPNFVFCLGRWFLFLWRLGLTVYYSCGTPCSAYWFRRRRLAITPNSHSQTRTNNPYKPVDYGKQSGADRRIVDFTSIMPRAQFNPYGIEGYDPIT
jgi:hypothetical protein